MMSYCASMSVAPIGSPTMTVVVRNMEPEDLLFAAELHGRSLRHGLFPALGRRFLVHYIGTYLRTSAGVALVAECAGKPAGFLVGVLDERTHYRQVIRLDGVRLTVVGLTALACRPRVAWRFFRTRAFRYVVGIGRLARGRSARSDRSTTDPPAAVLSHVAVLPDLRGAGVGCDLVEAFSAAARAASITTIRLTTRAGAEGAGDFYRHLGWRRTDTFMDADGLAWDRFRFDLS